MEKTLLLHRGKRKTVADLAIFTLGKKWPLRLKEIHEEIIKSGGQKVSLQATHKSLKKLAEKRIVTKQKMQYELNEKWLSDMAAFGTKTKKAYCKRQASAKNQLFG